MTKRQQTGFTLVEVTLAIAFLSILLIAILTITVTAGKLYIKGSTNQTINQSGRDFADTVRRDFLASGISMIAGSPTGAAITLGSGNLTSGRICLGTVSYLWNSAALLNAPNTDEVTIGVSNTPVKFARVVNPKQSYCDKDASGKYPTNIPSTEQVIDLFGGSGRDYALYSMAMTPVAITGDKGMYQISYTLGTNESGTTQKDSTNSFVQCKPNNSLTADFNYCSVDDFDMIVRVGGTK
ncbi:MAG TPA: hypothetical protein VLF64_00745 [Candidatus Saccharimonadales bacterium]|nr:hypothetical protein [Candidatus Saccharimonadales bacterium]